MKKLMFLVLMLLAVCSYAAYNIGEEVLPGDNISWTVSGPVPYTGSSTIFDEVSSGKAVMIFFGQTW